MGINAMILGPAAANTFIDSYKRVLLHLAGTQDAKLSTTHVLLNGREKLVAQPVLLEEAITAVKPDIAVTASLRTLDVRQWVYLRDTRSYSIFLEPSGSVAYAVVGLTERIRSIVGGTGALIETGIVQYADRWVCDGLISRIAWLGSGYKRGFTDTFRLLKENGQFHGMGTSSSG